MSKDMIGAKRKRTDENEENCYKTFFVQDKSEKATRLQDLLHPVYIGCPCCKRRVYQESNGDLACPYHGAQETPTYYYRLRVKLLEVETGTVLWLSLFDEIMAQFIRIDACEFDDLS